MQPAAAALPARSALARGCHGASGLAVHARRKGLSIDVGIGYRPSLRHPPLLVLKMMDANTCPPTDPPPHLAPRLPPSVASPSSSSREDCLPPRRVRTRRASDKNYPLHPQMNANSLLSEGRWSCHRRFPKYITRMTPQWSS